LLFKYDADRLVALLTQTGAQTADVIARKMLGDLSVHLGEEASSIVRLGRATAPDDGNKLSDLIRAAEARALPNSHESRPSIH
jgi:hypothetical protein